MEKKFRSFEDARTFVHQLKLKGQKDWKKFSKSGNRPIDIPSAPHIVYKKEWKTWGDWFGTGTVASYLIKFRPFNEARDFAHALKLQSQGKWFQFTKTGKLPSDIPTAPHIVYKKEWKSWGDWLGTGSIALRLRKYRSFEEAKEYVISLNLINNKQWRKYCSFGNKPENIPTDPELVYKNKGWISYGDWLGTGTIATHKRVYKPFSEAKKFAHELKLKSQTAWSDYVKSGKKPEGIPQSPYKVYKNEWRSWGDWLGTGSIAPQNKKYRSFEEARKFVRSLGLRKKDDWEKFSKSGKRPIDIPGNPNHVYKNKGWKNLGDWLGTGYIATSQREYRSFEEARKFAHSLKLKNQKNWLAYSKSERRPDFIPTTPDSVYKNKGWKGLGDWLGTGTVATFQRKYRSYEEARKFAHSLGLTGANEWRAFAKSDKCPNDIPRNPNQVYKDKGWKSWGDWTGTGIIATYEIKYRECKDARKFVHSLGLKSANEWRKFAKSDKKPKDVPQAPNNTYKNKGWKSWGDWLGTGRISMTELSKKFLSFKDARKESQRLAKELGITTRPQWAIAKKQGKIPDNIPANPWHVYAKNKRKKK